MTSLNFTHDNNVTDQMLDLIDSLVAQSSFIPIRDKKHSVITKPLKRTNSLPNMLLSKYSEYDIISSDLIELGNNKHNNFIQNETNIIKKITNNNNKICTKKIENNMMKSTAHIPTKNNTYDFIENYGDKNLSENISFERVHNKKQNNFNAESTRDSFVPNEIKSNMLYSNDNQHKDIKKKIVFKRTRSKSNGQKLTGSSKSISTTNNNQISKSAKHNKNYLSELIPVTTNRGSNVKNPTRALPQKTNHGLFSVDSIDDIVNKTNNISNNIINDANKNIDQTEQYLEDDRYKTIIECINYVIIIVDLLNRFIYKIYLGFQTTIMGKENNFTIWFIKYYDVLLDYFIIKMNDRTLRSQNIPTSTQGYRTEFSYDSSSAYHDCNSAMYVNKDDGINDEILH